jgi:hypothetical protein
MAYEAFEALLGRQLVPVLAGLARERVSAGPPAGIDNHVIRSRRGHWMLLARCGDRRQAGPSSAQSRSKRTYWIRNFPEVAAN